jgi:hypothetical protein
MQNFSGFCWLLCWFLGFGGFLGLFFLLWWLLFWFSGGGLFYGLFWIGGFLLG